MLHTVRTGETAFDHAHGTGLFEYLASHPDVGAAFNAGMLGNSPDHARLVAGTYDFSKMNVVVDVGGGRGRLLATISKHVDRSTRDRCLLSIQFHSIVGLGLGADVPTRYIEIARGSGGRGSRKRGEESPGSMERRCRVMPGGGDPRESATESNPPRFGAARSKGWGKSPPRFR